MKLTNLILVLIALLPGTLFAEGFLEESSKYLQEYLSNDEPNVKKEDPVKTIEYLDINKYLGEWYEIASIPAFFQKKCMGDTKASYALAEKNRISVINSCQTQNELIETEGRAKIVDSNSQAKLKVTFVNLGDWVFLFGGHYWVSGVGPNYEYAVVTHPDRDYGWILSRTPVLEKKFLKEAAIILLKNGYSLCSFKLTPQNGERMPVEKRLELCRVL